MFSPMPKQEVKVVGMGLPYAWVPPSQEASPSYLTVYQAETQPPTAPNSADDFVGPCPDGTTQTATGCAPNTPAPAPAPKAPAKNRSVYVVGGIAVVALIAAVLIPGK